MSEDGHQTNTGRAMVVSDTWILSPESFTYSSTTYY